MIEIVSIYRAWCNSCGIIKTMEDHAAITRWAELHNCSGRTYTSNVFDEEEKNGAAMDPHRHRKSRMISQDPRAHIKENRNETR